MFYYLIYSSSLTNYKDGHKKIITTLLYATIGYVLLHAFITLSESKLIQKLRLYFWIILLIDFSSMYYTYQNDDDVSNWYKNIGDIRDKFNSIISSSNDNDKPNNNNCNAENSNNNCNVENSNNNCNVSDRNINNDIVGEIVNDIDNENDDMVNRMLSSLAPPINDDTNDPNPIANTNNDSNSVPDFLKGIKTKTEKKTDLTDLIGERERSIQVLNTKKPDKKRSMSSNINDLINSTGLNGGNEGDGFEGSDIGSDIEMDFSEFEKQL